MKKFRRIVFALFLISLLVRFSVSAEGLKDVMAEKPQPCPAGLKLLVGGYINGGREILVYEKNQRLFVLYPHNRSYGIKQGKGDVFLFVRSGPGGAPSMKFTRNEKGQGVRCYIGGAVYKRKFYPAEGGKSFRINPVRPVEELRKKAMRMNPPRQWGRFRKPALVEVPKMDRSIKTDIRYATKNNFMGARMYKTGKAFMQKPAAEALVSVNKKLKKYGYGILIYDAYRPWFVTRMFWDATPDRLKHFVANPKNGSRHNRGAAVDVTLYRLKTGRPVEMTGGFDEFTRRSYSNFPGGTSMQRWHRKVLMTAMQNAGFTVYPYEWWHFDYKDWKKYPIMNVPFGEIK